MFIEPYDTEYMIYDGLTGRYVLTAKAALDYLDIDLNVLAKDNGNGVNAFLKRVAAVTYRKLHEYGFDEIQDKIVATTETGRKVIQEAMLEQLFYVKQDGDLSLSIKKEERELYASDGLESIFDRVIPETGRALTNLAVG